MSEDRSVSVARLRALVEQLLAFEDEACGDARVPEDVAVRLSSLSHRFEALLASSWERVPDASGLITAWDVLGPHDIAGSAATANVFAELQRYIAVLRGRTSSGEPPLVHLDAGKEAVCLSEESELEASADPDFVTCISWRIPARVFQASSREPPSAGFHGESRAPRAVANALEWLGRGDGTAFDVVRDLLAEVDRVRAGEPPREPEEHFCIRCHHRWTGDGRVEYCGDCHRLALAAIAASEPQVQEPTIEDCLKELQRVKAENARMARLVQTQRPEIQQLREIEVGLRDYLNNGAESLVRLHEQARALLPTNCDDLPSLAEMRGICSDGKARVDAALTCSPRSSQAQESCRAFDTTASPNVISHILDAPCYWCGYNGQGYWQANTHALSCPWHAIGGAIERANRVGYVVIPRLKALTLSPRPSQEPPT